MSHLKNNLIFNFANDFKSHYGKMKGSRKYGVYKAIEILAMRYDLGNIDAVINDEQIIPWALNLDKKISQSRKNECSIPENILQMIYKRYKNQSKDISSGKTNTVELVNKAKCETFKCISCRKETLKEKKKEHPIFVGSICDVCYQMAKKLIFISNQDDTNNICCICFKEDEDNIMVCCSYCVWVYGKICLKTHVGQLGLDTILKSKKWECFACVDSPLTSLKKKETIVRNIYKMYPGNDVTCADKAKPIVRKIILVPSNFNATIVETVLKNLNIPYEPNNFGDETLRTENNCAYLLPQYLPIRKINDSHCLMKSFFEFYLSLNKVLDSKLKTPFFWIYEHNLSISGEELKIISRFLKRDPILFGINAENVHQRGRLTWTNIQIAEKDKDFLLLRSRNIFRRSGGVQDNEDTSRCNETLELILNNLITK